MNVLIHMHDGEEIRYTERCPVCDPDIVRGREFIMAADKIKYDMELSDLERRYTYHPPKGNQELRYADIRANAALLAALLTEHCPESDERKRALDKLDECVMLANASIARNE